MTEVILHGSMTATTILTLAPASTAMHVYCLWNGLHLQLLFFVGKRHSEDLGDHIVLQRMQVVERSFGTVQRKS